MDNEQERSNIQLIYEYTKLVFNSINENISIVNNKLTTIIGFSALLLRFANDVEDCNQWLVIAKVTLCVFLVVAIILCILGLAPTDSGDVVSPEELRTDYYYAEDEECRRYITDNLINSIDQLDSYRDQKVRYSSWAILFLSLATITFAVITSFSSICKSQI